MSGSTNDQTSEDRFQVEPGPDGGFRFQGSRGNHATPSEREQLRAEAIQNLGLQEADDTVRRLLDPSSKQTNTTK